MTTNPLDAARVAYRAITDENDRARAERNLKQWFSNHPTFDPMTTPEGQAFHRTLSWLDGHESRILCHEFGI